MSESRKPMSLRARIARLDALMPDDPDLHCCLDNLAAWREALRPHYEANWTPHLDLGDPEPPLDPPELPPCRRSGGPLCAFACDLVRLHWKRRRQIALDFAGLDEEEI